MISKEDFPILIQLASVVYNRTALFYCLAILVQQLKSIHCVWMDSDFCLLTHLIKKTELCFHFCFVRVLKQWNAMNTKHNF